MNLYFLSLIEPKTRRESLKYGLLPNGNVEGKLETRNDVTIFKNEKIIIIITSGFFSIKGTKLTLIFGSNHKQNGIFGFYLTSKEHDIIKFFDKLVVQRSMLSSSVSSLLDQNIKHRNYILNCLI
jgi:hypothetical protein